MNIKRMQENIAWSECDRAVFFIFENEAVFFSKLLIHVTQNYSS